MPLPYELEQLQRKLARLEVELAEAKQQLARLGGPPETAAPVAPLAAPVAAAPAAPPLLPPVLPAPVEPPLLPPVLAVPAAPVAAPTGGLRTWLEGIGLWPPQGDANTEARLGAWWATRLGALLAVIGVVFFAVYVSRNTPPVVKLAELVAVAFAVFFVGLRLERRVPRFGQVLTGAGLALLYFSAFAAYAVPATRVLTDPLAAAVAQLATVAVILGFAAWRRSEGTATMAVGLGFVTAFFSGYTGLGVFSLWSALALAAGAVALKFRPGWRSPSVVALPLTFLVYVVLGYSHWAGAVPPPAPAGLWLPLLAAFGLFLLRDGVVAVRGVALTGDDRLLQNLNSSVAITAGFLVTARVLPEALSAWWFWSGGIMVAVALGWWRLAQPGSLVPVAACKAAGLLALGVMTAWDGHARWLVLLTQAFVLLVAARATGIRGLRVIMALVWGASLCLLFWALATAQPAPLGATLVYLVFSALLLGFDERWLGGERGFGVVAGALLGGVAGYAANALLPAGWLPAGLMGLGAVLGGMGLASRGWRGPLAAAGFLVLAAHLAMLGYRAPRFPASWLWLNEAALLAGVVAGGALLRRSALGADPAGNTLRSLLAFASVLVLPVVLTKGFAPAVALTASAGVAVLLTGLAPRLRDWPLIAAGTLTLALGWLLYGPFQPETADAPWLFAAAAGGWLLPALLQAWPGLAAPVTAAGQRRLLAVIQGILATWLTLLALRGNFSGAPLVTAAAVAAGLVFVLGWRLAVRPAPVSASVLLLFGAAWAAPAWAGNLAWVRSAGWPAVAGVGLLAVVAVLLPVLARRIGDWAGGWRRVALWLHGGGALLLLFWFFGVQRGGLQPYATVLWGGAAILLFALGLFARERVYRLLGLGGLILCVPRAFLVDLDSTLYRIAAFVALGVVLLWVGFSYHRFRHLIAEPAEPAEDSPPKTG